MPTVGLFHPGRQHSWQTSAALAASGALAWHATAIYYDPKRQPYAAASLVGGQAGRKLRRFLERRASPLVSVDHVRHLAAFEWAELSMARLGWRRAAARTNRLGNAWFQRGVLKLMQREPVELLWGYDTSCDWLFSRPETQSAIRVLDQTAGHAGAVREILMAQRERHGRYFGDDEDVPTPAAVAQANREVAGASHIVVGAQHAVDALLARGIEPGRIHLAPYGYDEARFADRPSERPGLGTLPVRFLFVGSVGPRKGVHLLLEAFKRIPSHQARLRLVGPLAMAESFLRGQGDNIEYSPPLPHERIVEEYAKAHCFLFPTLIDGGGIVLYEAAACGLGIIQSPTCGDGVREGPLGSNGIVLRENTVDALQAAIESVIATPSILRDWSAASLAMRHERTWSAYRRRIGELLPKLL